MARELEDGDLVAAAASLRMPGEILVELVQYWNGLQLYDLVLQLLEPVLRKLPQILGARPRERRYGKPIGEVLEPLLKVFVDSLMEGGGPAKETRWRKRLLAELPAELHHAVTVLSV